uniref:Uncharacterized protein n=1 Tax=Caenorhabditis japonica TaxID=281687 RepID=A0A8R1IK17_CAEJA
MNMWFNLTYLLSYVIYDPSFDHGSSSPPLPLPTIIDATNLTHVDVFTIPYVHMKDPIVNPDMWVCGSGPVSHTAAFHIMNEWCREKMRKLLCLVVKILEIVMCFLV